jgi:putative PIN family toxin of toxin-antitoxin system
MLVVLDTNVIVSSLLSTKGSPAEIIQRWEAEEFDVATSPLLLAELERTLAYPKVKKYLERSGEAISTLLKRFGTAASLVEPESNVQVIKRDPDDNRVLECAKAAGAGFIVSGDEHLLALKEYEGITILSPGEFIILLEK